METGDGGNVGTNEAIDWIKCSWQTLIYLPCFGFW